MRLAHGRVSLALHTLRSGSGPALLLLHALGGSSADWGGVAAAWPGPVHALDFSGHGASGWLPGGGYTPEYFAGEADLALARIGEASLAGAGLGAYVALLLAGARRQAVRACLLLPGRGLDGGGPEPDFSVRPPELPSFPERRDAAAPDPLVVACEQDIRPPDYAEEFARAARRLLLAGAPNDARPPWWQAARHSPSAEAAPDDPVAALRQLSAGRHGG